MIGSRLDRSEPLPSGWYVRNLGEIGKYLNGYPFKPTQWKTKGLPIIRIQNLTDEQKPFNYFDGRVDPRYLIKPGDVLVSWSASLGAFRWTRGTAWLNQHIFKATPNAELIDRRFFYFLMRHTIERVAKNARGSTMHHVTLKEFVHSEVAMPASDEQRQIAAVLSAVNGAIERQERLIALTTELKKALMHKLFTEGTRREPLKHTEIEPVPKSWGVRPLGEYLVSAQYGLSVKGANDGGTPILRMTNQMDGRIVASKLQMVNISKSDLSKFKLEPGDVLFNRTNSVDLVGRTAIFDLVGDYVFASYLIRLQTQAGSLRPAFLNHYFNWEAVQARLKGIASRAVSQSNISASRLRGFLVPIPSPEEQDEIIRCLDQADRMRSVRQRQLSVLQGLFRTVLHQLMTAEIRVHDLDLSALNIGTGELAGVE